jgi:enoyl-CoA hydratase/carnithine racemase
MNMRARSNRRTVEVSEAASVVTIAMNRPERLNALNTLMSDELRVVLAELTEDGAIAKVSGAAYGGGYNLSLMCDLVVASPTARFAEIFFHRGLSVDSGGSRVLPRLVGLHRAEELPLFGTMLPAAEAYRSPELHVEEAA